MDANLRLLLQALGAGLMLVLGVLIGDQIWLHKRTSDISERVARTEIGLEALSRMLRDHLELEHRQRRPPTPYGADP